MLTNVPGDITMELFSYLNPCQLGEFLVTHKELKSIIESKVMLTKMSNDYGLPYSSSLEELCDYYNLPRFDLVMFAIKHNYFHVIDFHIKDWMLGKALAEAALHGNEQVVMYILESSDQIEDFEYDKALENAAKKGYIKIVDMILEMNVSKDGIYQAFLNAAFGGHIDIFDKLLKMMEDHDMVQHALVESARNGKIEMVKHILNLNLNVEYDYDNLAGWAAFSGNEDLLNMFVIDMEAEITPLSIMVNSAHSNNLELFKRNLRIAESEEDIDSELYGTALQNAVPGGNIDIVNILLSKDIEYEDYSGALIIAATYGNIEVFKMIMPYIRWERNFDLSDYDEEIARLDELSTYGSAIEAAAFNNHKDIIQISLDRYVELVDKLDFEDEPIPEQAIKNAVAGGHIKLIKWFMTQDYLPYVPDSLETIIELALENKRPDIAELLSK